MSRGTLPTTPTPQTSDKNERLRLMAFALGGALRGDPQFAAQTLALQEKKKAENLYNRAYQTASPEQKKLLEALTLHQRMVLHLFR